jgi:outer membrane receptor protein involved in Fe transport
MVSALALAALIDPTLALAQTQSEQPGALTLYPIAISAARLSDALTQLSRQTGASIGSGVRLPRARIAPLSGRMTVATALRQILAGTGLQARHLHGNLWRIERAALPRPTPVPPQAPRAAPPPPRQPTEQPPPPAAPSPDIIVTAAKQEGSLATTPIASSVLRPDPSQDGSAAPGTDSASALVDSMAMTNIGPGRNRSFLRGVGDSPFNGPTQSTVATLIDDARITFNAPDPNVRLVDVDRVEILKGPQGPLYGAGALGGVYRIVTHRVDLTDIDASATATAQASANTGALGVSGNAMVNLPIITDTLGLRVVAYGENLPGWIDDSGGAGQTAQRGINASRMSGGRATLGWQPALGWTVALAGAAQFAHGADSQYVNDARSVTRTGILPEPHDNDFANARLSATGPLGDAHFLYSGSMTWHEVDAYLDASAAAPLFGRTGPTRFEDDHLYRVMNHELRLWGNHGEWRWLIGASLLNAATEITGKLAGPNDADQVIGTLDEHVSEIALYGEAGVPLASRLRMDIGVRLFESRVKDDLAILRPGVPYRDKRFGASPSLSLAFTPDEDSYFYIRAASAFRPRGLSAFAPVPDEGLASDELNSLSAGARWHHPDDIWALQIETYASQWIDMQADYLLPNGLVATHNSGNGIIYGVEVNAHWAPSRRWTIDAGFDAQHAMAEAAGTADTMLQVVPQYKAHIGLGSAFSYRAVPITAHLNARLTGPGRLSIYSDVERQIPATVFVDATASARLGQWRIGFAVQNMLDSRVDTFPFGNPFSIRIAPQHTPPRPRTISLTFSWALGE